MQSEVLGSLIEVLETTGLGAISYPVSTQVPVLAGNKNPAGSVAKTVRVCGVPGILIGMFVFISAGRFKLNWCNDCVETTRDCSHQNHVT